jgi:DNA-directed RNA polymerase subunit RPC12/RpoP
MNNFEIRCLNCGSTNVKIVAIKDVEIYYRDYDNDGYTETDTWEEEYVSGEEVVCQDCNSNEEVNYYDEE